jgi:luciferase family oxidoreductase group 1
MQRSDPLPLSVLDLSPVVSGSTPSDALLTTVRLAQRAEALGYARYWVAEHHNAKGLACSSPEVLIAVIASRTVRLRVGSGGVMLPNHSPLKVAETFRTLSAFFPDRIDLGLGRAPGSDPRTARVLRRLPEGAKLPPPEAMEEDVRALLGFLAEEPGPRAAFATSVVAVPSPVTPPVVHVLGQSDYGGSLAARLGLPFAFAHHFAPDDAAVVTRAYRRDFVPSALLGKPHVIVATAALAADTEEEARRHAKGARLRALQFATGLRDLPVPSVEEAEAHVWSEEDARLAPPSESRFVGSAAQVMKALLELREQTGADELMITTSVHDERARRRSYELLASVER